MHHRRKCRDQCGRPALFEIWRDPQLRDRARNCAGQWRCPADWRARAQKQNRLRPGRSVCRLGRNAWRRHGGHAAFAPASACARDFVDCLRNGHTSGRSGTGDFCGGIPSIFIGDRRPLHAGSGPTRSGQNDCARGQRTSAGRSGRAGGKRPQRVRSHSRITLEEKIKRA